MRFFALKIEIDFARHKKRVMQFYRRFNETTIQKQEYQPKSGTTERDQDELNIVAFLCFNRKKKLPFNQLHRFQLDGT